MKPAHDDWNWSRDKRKQSPEQDKLDAATQCALFCAWKGGGPCLAADCPREFKNDGRSRSVNTLDK